MDVRNKQTLWVLISSISFALGLLFYLGYRPQILGVDLSLGFIFQLGLSNLLPAWLLASFPSFIFMPLVSGVSVLILKNNGLQSTKYTVLCSCTWLGLVLLFECLQASTIPYLSRGTFDWLDIAAAITGSLLSIILLNSTSSEKSVSNPLEKSSQPWLLVPALILGMAAILGSTNELCDESNGNNADERCVKQVILSWEEIRADIQPDLSTSEVLTRTGKIYSLDEWLFIVEKYRGIHIFDMTDSLNPIRKIYLPIPGALDLTIKDGILYSSAFTDLVTIDLNVLQQSEGLDVSSLRQEDVFEYPSSRQFYPDYYYSSYDEPYARDIGVVIGYKTKSGKVILYGDEYDLQTKEKHEAKENDEDEITVDIGCLLLRIWMC